MQTPIDLIQKQGGGDSTKIINLVKSIEKAAQEAEAIPSLLRLRSARGPFKEVATRSGKRQRQRARRVPEGDSENEGAKGRAGKRGVNPIQHISCCAADGRRLSRR